MKAEHTPGPWAWQRFGNQYNLTAQHGMREIIIAANPVRGSNQPAVVMNHEGILQPIDPTHPNAALIAAAPETAAERDRLLRHTKQVYLELQMAANGSVAFALDTDHIRASLRNIIAEVEGRECEDVQNENETLSRA